VLAHHPEWRGKLVLVQVTSAPRAPGRDVEELHAYCAALVAGINARFGAPGYEPVVWLERPVPLYERCALYSVADVAVVTATRDGMNLAPYEYIVCRQAAAGIGVGVGVPGAAGAANAADAGAAAPPPPPPPPPARPGSALVVSEFVGCSPSLSGAVRVNPWSIDAVRDAIYAAITSAPADRAIRHEKHWRYVSTHTCQYWARSFVADLARFTRGHAKLQCFDLGFALDTFRMVALTKDFRKLAAGAVARAFHAAGAAGAPPRVLLLDHDGTLVPQSSLDARPSAAVLETLAALTADGRNRVWIMSGRGRGELERWFGAVPRLGLTAEHGFYWRPPGAAAWATQDPEASFGWRDIVLPILELYAESTDGSYIEAKESALVWHHRDADPDFGSWQAKELLDHLEGVLANEAVEVVPGQAIVEVKPQGVSKGRAAERALSAAAAEGAGPPAFVLCIGNDRSDEEMFNAVLAATAGAAAGAGGVFACTVGQKPSKAPFYVNDAADVVATLARLAAPEEAEGGGGAPVGGAGARAVSFAAAGGAGSAAAAASGGGADGGA
jgi:trehalose 6-phosphate synthase/phosphatase